jgi:DNA-binding HxlR family transcriptional regulator
VSKPPLKVAYSLTKFGRTCLPLFEELSKWGLFVGNSKSKLVEI